MARKTLHTYIHTLEALTQYSSLSRLPDKEEITCYWAPVFVTSSTAVRSNLTSVTQSS